MILDLVRQDNGSIKYIISQFPDGQQDVTIDDPIRVGTEILAPLKPITIVSRFNNFKDLELIICATKALKRIGFKSIHLFIPYLLGSRSDRQFVDGGNSYLVDIIAPIINSLEFESVTVMDVHSDVADACIKNLKVIDNIKLVYFMLDKTYPTQHMGTARHDSNLKSVVIVSPDAGALKKIHKVADVIGYGGDIITCSKHRKTNGELSKVVVPMGHLWNSSKDAIIIDDICDGGATFINIAKEMKDNGWKNKIYLIVTHGIFSKGFDELSKYFDGIYTTNSCKDVPLNDGLVKVLDVFTNLNID